MYLILKKNYKLNNYLDIFIDKKKNIFVVKNIFGIFFFFLPSFYFIKNEINYISIIFNKNFFFKSFFYHFLFNYMNIINLYFIRLKIKGLGYQIYKISKNLYSFHFNYINFFYFFLPYNILSFWYKKRIVFISNNVWLLKIVFKCILLLKKLGPYSSLGIRYPRQIIILKKGGKSKLK